MPTEPPAVLTATPTVITPAAGPTTGLVSMPIAPLDLAKQIWTQAHPESAAVAPKPTNTVPVTPPQPDPAKPATVAVVTPPPESPKSVVTSPAEPEVLDPDIEKWRPPRSKDDWKSFKTEARKREQALQTKLSEIQQKLGGQDVAAMETVVKERDELRQRLQQVSLEADPSFTKEYQAKESALISSAKRAAGEQAARIEILLKAPPSDWRQEMLDNLASELTPGRAATVGAAVFALDTLRADREAKLADAPAINAQLNAQRQIQTKQQQDALKLQFNERAKEWTTKFPFLVERPDFQDKAVMNFSGKMEVEEAMDACFSAAAFPAVLESHLTILQENEALKTELAKYKSGVPNAGAGSGPTPANSQGQYDLHEQIRKGQTSMGNVIGNALRQQGYVR